MGCSNSKNFEKPYPDHLNGIRRMPFIQEKDRFNKNHEKFESLFMNADFKEDLVSITEQTNFETFFEKFFSKWLLKLENIGIKREDVKELILQIVTDELIRENFQKLNCNVNEWIFSVAENFDFSKEEKFDILKSLVYSANRIYAFSQKAMIIYHPDLEVINKYGLKALLDNIKYKQDYKSQIIILWISHQFFDNEETIIDLCEIIENNENLTTVCILLKFEANKISNPKYLQLINNLRYLFDTISLHRSVISVLFANMGEQFINIPFIVIKAFNKMMAKDKFLFVGVSRIIFDPSSLEDLFNNVAKMRNLKYILLDLKCEGNYLNDFINSIGKNRKLIGAVIGSMSLPNNALGEIENRVKSASPNFKFFHFQKNFSISY